MASIRRGMLRGIGADGIDRAGLCRGIRSDGIDGMRWQRRRVSAGGGGFDGGPDGVRAEAAKGVVGADLVGGDGGVRGGGERGAEGLGGAVGGGAGVEAGVVEVHGALEAGAVDGEAVGGGG